MILEKVSGIYLLVALRSAWGDCPFALIIAPVSACIWQCMKDGMDDAAIREIIIMRYQFSEKKVENILRHFVSDAEKFHYFIPEETAQ